MKTGLHKFIPGKSTINFAHFFGLVTFKNGIITEEIGADSEIYESYSVGVRSNNWNILVNNDNYIILKLNEQNIKKDVAMHIKIDLTLQDKEFMEEIRDKWLVGSKNMTEQDEDVMEMQEIITNFSELGFELFRRSASFTIMFYNEFKIRIFMELDTIKIMISLARAVTRADIHIAHEKIYTRRFKRENADEVFSVIYSYYLTNY